MLSKMSLLINSNDVLMAKAASVDILCSPRCLFDDDDDDDDDDEDEEEELLLLLLLLPLRSPTT
jgi:hypothetical protein